MALKQVREFAVPRLKNYNDSRAVLRIAPLRTADQDRDHELIVTREEIPDLIAALTRVLGYRSPHQTPLRPVLCAHADQDGRGAHWLAPGEKCDHAEETAR